MDSINYSGVSFYQNGSLITASASQYVGYAPSYSTKINMFIAFTTNASGASRIKFSISNIEYTDGCMLSWYVTDNIDNYKNAFGTGVPNYGAVTFKTGFLNNKTASGEYNVSLLPNKKYYICLIPSQAMNYIMTYKSQSVIKIETNPATSTVSASDTIIGENCNITIGSYLNTNTHTLTYLCGSASGTIATGVTASSYQWAVPISIYDAMQSDDTEITCSITCETFNSSGSSIGTSKATIKLYASRSAPSINFTSFTVTPDLSATVGSCIIANMHKLESVIVSAATTNGATVSSVSVRNSNVTKTATHGSGTSYSAGPWGNYITSGKIAYYMTDSRGNTSSESLYSIPDYILYVKPSVNMYVSTMDANGELTMTISGSYYNGSINGTNNTLTLRYKTATNNGAYGSYISISANVNSDGTFSATKKITGLNYENTYKFKAYAYDMFGTSYQVESNECVSRSNPLFYWGSDSFTFNVPVTFADGQSFGGVVTPYDYVIDSGTSTVSNADGTSITWYYKKWNNGQYECSGKYTKSEVNAAKTNYSGFYYSDSISVNLPITFADVPVVNCFGGCHNYLVFISQVGEATNSLVKYVAVTGTSSATSCTINVNIKVSGRWK